LLWGNHDVQYRFFDPDRPDIKYGCSGFKFEVASMAKMVFETNKKLFQATYQIGDHLWSHAGMSNRSYDIHFKKFSISNNQLSDELNRLFHIEQSELFAVGMDRGGRDPVGGIFWIDKQEVMADPLDGFHQIVGHSQIDKITTVQHIPECPVTFVDVMDTFFIKEIIVDD